jgi:Ser/Thr protein kinase RdoA (MazF antagonist)
MEGVPGVRFWDPSSARLRSLVEMVISLHQALRSGVAVQPDRYRRSVSDPLASLLEFDNAAAVREGCAGLAERIAPAWLDALPVIPQHADLFLDNILTDGQQWHIVDWESFGSTDFPFYDLGTVLVSRLRTGGETPQHWDAALAAQTPALVKRYAEKIGLLSADIRLLLPLTLVNWFHLHWCDGRRAFTRRMYHVITHYFEHTSTWEEVFLWSSRGAQ